MKHPIINLSPALLRELDRLFAQNNDKVFSKDKKPIRDASRATRLCRRNIIFVAFKDLYRLGFQLQSPFNLGQKHLTALGEYWQTKQLSARTIHTRFSALRVFSVWMGKPDLVRDLGEYCGGREHLVRHSVCKVSKAWPANGVDPIKIIAQAESLDPRFALMLRLQLAFGLRVKEALELKPRNMLLADGNSVRVYEGTKGGRIRVVPLVDTAYRELIHEAIVMVDSSRNSRLRWPDKTVSQAQQRFYYLCRKLGITRKGLGVTAHGLRHGFAQTLYTEKAAVPSPIETTGKPNIDAVSHRMVSQLVSEAMGHGRVSVTATYYGSYGHSLRSTKPSLKWV